MAKIITDEKLIDEILERGVDEIIEKESLRKKLLSGKQLRVKFGIDPTSPDLHLGHSVPLRKLKKLQELGHKIILLIGDFTAKIGDPTGRNEARKILTDEEIKNNFRHYEEQAAKILDIKKTEVRFNSEWYNKKGYAFLFELTSKFTVARVLERDDFKKRIKEDIDISMTEILYPLLQGYDSVALLADIELGGTDQKFNLLMGRKVQRRYNQKEQDVIMLPLLEGTDGIHKMSKSLGNYIGISEEPNNMFVKIMSLPDSLIIKYFNLLTDILSDDIEKFKKDLRMSLINPRDLKLKLAFEITKIYHDEDKAKKAQEYFEKVVSRKEMPDEIMPSPAPPETKLVDLIVKEGLAKSNGDAKRKIQQGGVKIDDKVIKDVEMVLYDEDDGKILKVGKREFRKIVVE